MNDDLIENTAAYIARYLAERPAAVDTVEGVQRFWLDAKETELTLDVTRAALELLAQRGVTEVRKVGDRMLWRRRLNDATA
ncbi:hypothetical protein [Burkholderia sp. 3C]